MERSCPGASSDEAGSCTGTTAMCWNAPIHQVSNENNVLDHIHLSHTLRNQAVNLMRLNTFGLLAILIKNSAYIVNHSTIF